MSKTKKIRLQFNRRGGVIIFEQRMLKSPAYNQLPAQPKVLMTLMQIHWRHYEPVAYGIREAMAKIPCAKATAQKAFKELEALGFITLMEESLFNSRTMSRSRTWKLNWMPYNDKPPTNEWEKNELTGPNTHPREVL